MPGGRNIQQSEGSMPSFAVTMKSNGATNQKDAFQSHPCGKHCR
jgi:hypothetical protein